MVPVQLLLALLLPLTAVAQFAGLRAHTQEGREARSNHKIYQETRRQLEEQYDFMKRWQNDTYRYKSDKTEPFLVTSLPFVDWDFGELYAGLIPITNNNSEALFFIFAPKVGDPVDEVTIWLNGGPGCSSQEGFWQENGPIIWRAATYQPVPNPYSWNNLTNMLYVDQPIGTGFSIGTVTAKSQEDIADNFVTWFKNFQDTFGIKNNKIHITGESYAGRYVPYISAAMLNQNNTENYDLQGALVYDPCIGEFASGQAMNTVPHIQKYAELWGFNDTYMNELAQQQEACGWNDYIDTYLTFPPPGNQPEMYVNYSNPANWSCAFDQLVFYEVFDINACFNPYSINDRCPIPFDPLGMPGDFEYTPAGAFVYPNRDDVKQAIHAPMNVNWSLCGVSPAVFVGDGGPQQGENDESADPIQHVLPQVIEATNRVLVSNGDFDSVILTNTTLLAIQNMTWNGQLGFQSAPNESFVVTEADVQWTTVFDESGLNGLNGPQGVIGVQHYERGLMWVQTFMAGHMQPEFQPRAAYKHLEWVLGRIDQF